MSRLWLQATQTCQLPTQIHKETSAAMFFGQNTSGRLALMFIQPLLAVATKDAVIWRWKSSRAQSSKSFSQKLKDT